MPIKIPAGGVAYVRHPRIWEAKGTAAISVTLGYVVRPCLKAQHNKISYRVLEKKMID